jgi:CheY-like chemotaxis protein
MSEQNFPRRKTILLAEDDASMRRYIEIILTNAGFDVLAEEDGLAAMQTAFKREVDAVVADAIMPNLTGYDLCRMLRGDAEKRAIPLILLSGLEPENETADIADVYLLKGEKLKEELIETLSKFFKN